MHDLSKIYYFEQEITDNLIEIDVNFSTQANYVYENKIYDVMNGSMELKILNIILIIFGFRDNIR